MCLSIRLLSLLYFWPERGGEKTCLLQKYYLVSGKSHEIGQNLAKIRHAFADTFLTRESTISTYIKYSSVASNNELFQVFCAHLYQRRGKIIWLNMAHFIIKGGATALTISAPNGVTRQYPTSLFVCCVLLVKKPI